MNLILKWFQFQCVNIYTQTKIYEIFLTAALNKLQKIKRTFIFIFYNIVTEFKNENRKVITGIDMRILIAFWLRLPLFIDSGSFDTLSQTLLQEQWT